MKIDSLVAMADFATMLASLLLGCSLIAIFAKWQSRTKLKEPPWLDETIPFVSNAWQYMTDKELFITRLRESFKSSPVLKCYLGPLKMHFISAKHISIIFRSSFASEPWIERIIEHAAGYSLSDVAKFSRDVSGCASTALTSDGRIWYAMHRMYDESLVSSSSVNMLSESFQVFFAQQLSMRNGVEEIRLLDFLKKNMATAATRAMFGDRILDVNPGFVDAFWEWDQYAETLAFGLPSWLNRKALTARNRVRAMCLKWYEIAIQEFDLTGVGSLEGVHWEPVFGSRMSTGLAQWGKSFGFSPDSMGASYSLAVFGLNSNTIPICAWMMMELVRDPSLWQAVRKEVEQAMISEGPTAGQLDCRKLTTLPLLQSVYVETLRIHIHVLITRTCTEPVTISGYRFPKGCFFQAPTQAAHLDEAVWGIPGHPACEFWGYRHLKKTEVRSNLGQVTEKFEFSLRAKSAYLFPYGGGISMCAGRSFAKREILLAVAMIVSKFEVEFLGWIKSDGSSSDRPAKDNWAYANAVASPPDREMMTKWRKRVD
ncbi:cytochrome P450 [Xylaria acuta]|nr:cytochrome P450 [Xylaria acuta]